MPSVEKMGYRRLGNSGLKVSTFGLGGWLTFGKSISDASSASKLIHRAFDAGINFFDIADVYAMGDAERVMGAALRDLPRHELVISTKLFWPASEDVNDRGLSRKHVMESIDRSLKRIGTDYVDMYFCHRHDEATPLLETARAMDDLVHQGKVLYWGTSEWSGAQIREAHATCDHRNLHAPQVEQPQYNLLARDKVERDVRPAAQDHGMGLVVWSPLGSGMLTGKYDEGIRPGTRLSQIEWLAESVRTEENVARVRQMRRVADEAGCTRAQLALAWAAAQPGISSVILGVTRPEQLEENLGALDVDVTPAMGDRLDAIFPAAC